MIAYVATTALIYLFNKTSATDMSFTRMWYKLQIFMDVFTA